jgi:tetratricopeptide (TPR) repeat protein
LQQGNGDIGALDGYLWSLALNKKYGQVIETAGKYVDGDFAPIALFRIAEAKMSLGDKQTAVEYCRKAADKAGDNEKLVSNILAEMYSLLGSEEVLKYCTEKLEKEPNSLAANSVMFYVAKINGEYNKAITYVDKCLEIVKPENEAAVVDYTAKKASVLEAAYYKTGDDNYLKKAIAVYESLLEKMPNDEGVMNNLAYMLAEHNEKLPEALEYARKAYEKNPNNPGFLDTYAYALYKNGKNSEAAEFLQIALQQFELNQISAPAPVYDHLGLIKEQLGEKTQAAEAYKQALKVGVNLLSEAAVERIKNAIERVSQ